MGENIKSWKKRSKNAPK